MGAPVTWFEINTSEAPAVQKFYSEIFEWEFQSVPGGDYAMVEGGKGIGGGIGSAQGANQVTFYLEVDNPQEYLDRIEKAGGRTIMPVTVIPDMVTFAQFADPQGNVVGLVKRQD